MMELAVARIPDFQVKKHIDEYLQDRSERLEKLAGKFKGQGLEVQSKVLMGVPHEALLQEIKYAKADLLVMGTKGRTNLMDTLIGSYAQKCFDAVQFPC